MTCQHLEGAALCGRTETRLYIAGDRCRLHTPAAIAGRLDHAPDPDLKLDALRASAGQVWSLHVQQHKGRTITGGHT